MKSYNFVLYHIRLDDIALYYNKSFHFILDHVIFYEVFKNYIVYSNYYLMLDYSMVYYVILEYVSSFILNYATYFLISILYYIILCHTLVSFVTLCCTIV